MHLSGTQASKFMSGTVTPIRRKVNPWVQGRPFATFWLAPYEPKAVKRSTLPMRFALLTRKAMRSRWARQTDGNRQCP